MKYKLIPLLLTSAVPLLQAATVGNATISPDSLSFGNEPLNSSHSLTVAVKDFSFTMGVNIASITLQRPQGQPQAIYRSSTNCTPAMAPGGQCQTTITFTPSVVGPEAATLIFKFAGGATQNVPISGTGVIAAPTLTFSTTSLTFGTTKINTNTAPESITVTNTGFQAADFTSIVYKGANSVDFISGTGANSCHNSSSLASGASCVIPVIFSPSGEAGVSRVASLTLTDNDNGVAGSTQTITLSGTAEFGVPLIETVNPVSKTVANAGKAFSMTISGANLTRSSVVSLNGAKLSASKTASGLQLTIPAGLITSAGTPLLSVSNPGTPASNSFPFPVPTASTIPQFVANPGANVMSLANGFIVTTGDFNHDGKQDIVVCSPPLVAVYLANGDGSYRISQEVQPQAIAQFNPTQPAQPTVVAMLPYAVVTGDFNSDGIPDLAVISYPASVVIYRGMGDGTFLPMTMDPNVGLPRGYVVGNNPTFGVVADFNRDGKMDIATSDLDGTISILQGAGDGSFTLSNLIQGYGGGALAVGDFNNDGVVDLAALSTGSNNVHLLFGDGALNFSAGPALPTGVAPQSLITADFNGDGFPDFAVTNTGSNFVTILLGGAGGTFTAAAKVATPAAPHFAAAGDVNGDGHMDLVVANGTDGSVSVLLGSGNGTFSPAYAPVKIGANMTAVYMVDSNNDGRLDLMVFDASANKVTTLVSK